MHKFFVTVAAISALSGAAAADIQPAVDGILQAFRTHSLVGLGDDHGLAQELEFYAALIRDPRFAREVGNVVVEFGASGRQDVIDRYVAGENLRYTELRTAWSDTIGWIPPPGTLGVANFFAAVRAANKSLPKDRRIRVWLGEPPIDWSAATHAMAAGAMNQRDSFPAGLIEENILAKSKKALVIYGHAHYVGRDSMRGRVEAKYPGAFYFVLPYSGPHHPGACAALLEQASKSLPALLVPGSAAAPDPVRECATYSYAVSYFSVSKAGAPATPPTAPEAKTEALDGVLFLGPPESLARTPFLPDYALDTGYRREMSRRSQVGGPPLIRVPAGYSFRRADYKIDLEAPGFAEAIDAMFAQYDLNGDGVVTADEYVDPIPK